MKISKDIKIDLFTRMVKVRTFEDDTNKIFMAGKEMPGFLHLSQGEDAMAAGTCANLEIKMPFTPPTAVMAASSPRALT